MNISVTGATGFIGRNLVHALAEKGHSVRALSRAAWNVTAGEPPAESIAAADAIIYLAGEPVAQRWTPWAKRRIRDSRVLGTHHLVSAISSMARRPEVLICASAIGIYGNRGDEILTESSPIGSGFLANVCRDWEHECDLAEPLGVRVVKIRIGIVLGRHGGALERMLPPFRAFVGGKLGVGAQWMSWVHIDDLVGIISHAITHPIRGAVNATSPNPVRNSEFTQQLAATLHRPAIVPVPAIGLRLLFGQMSQILLDSQRVLPKAVESSGYRFAFPNLSDALNDLSGKN
ncbi:MAG TPA: TIGR01777 family oxidoreductase [Bryobacteraceae bacterium]|nr:TIGR01777 family oxidoreductase [Bryobacteraceae bacterium]